MSHRARQLVLLVLIGSMFSDALGQPPDAPDSNPPVAPNPAVGPRNPNNRQGPRNPFELALAAQRPRDRFRTRLARSPDMFGDLFGSASGTLTTTFATTATAIQAGVTNGSTGTATFAEANVTLPLIQPLAGNVQVVAVPGLATTTGATTTTFLVDTGNNVAVPAQFNADAAALANADANVNQATFLTPLQAAILLAEQAADPTATLQTVTVTSQNPVSTANVVVGTGAGNADLLFPIVVQTLVSITSTTNTTLLFNVPSPSTGGAVVGRLKIAENASPLPRDRVFVGYSYFDNVPLIAGGVNVNRLVPGFEKTLFDQTASIRVRVPMATTLDSNVNLDGRTTDDHGELGNVTIDYKHLLVSRDDYYVSAGLGVALPTADDLAIQLFGRDFIRAENEGVRLLPYVAGLASLGDRWFVQGFLQLDFDTNGNTIHLDSGNGNGLVPVGRAQDPTFLFLDLAVGYWIVDRPRSEGWLHGIVATTELHYNRALQSGDVVDFNGLQIGDFSRNTEVLNGVVGATASVGRSSTIGLAYVMPLGSGADQQFDGEFRLTFNRFFGPTADRVAPGRP